MKTTTVAGRKFFYNQERYRLKKLPIGVPGLIFFLGRVGTLCRIGWIDPDAIGGVASITFRDVSKDENIGEIIVQLDCLEDVGVGT